MTYLICGLTILKCLTLKSVKGCSRRNLNFVCVFVHLHVCSDVGVYTSVCAHASVCVLERQRDRER